MIWWHDVWILERKSPLPWGIQLIWMIFVISSILTCLLCIHFNCLPCFLLCLSSTLTGCHSALWTACSFKLLCLCSCPSLRLCGSPYSAHYPVLRFSLLTLLMASCSPWWSVNLGLYHLIAMDHLLTSCLFFSICIWNIHNSTCKNELIDSFILLPLTLFYIICMQCCIMELTYV